MGLFPKLGFGTAAPVCNTEDIYDLLIAVLPTFISLAYCIWRRLDASEDSTVTQDFYLHFRAKVVNLHAVLFVWNPLETVQSLSTDEAEVKKNLLRILDELETRFLSWKGEEVGAACRRLQLERRKDETYPKLRALRRILPEDDNLNENFVSALTVIIRIDNKRADKREKLLQNLDQALGFFYNLQPSPAESESSCFKRFSDYPLRHVRKFTNALFEVLQRNWSYQCPNNRCRIDRKTRLNLTRYQRFDTAPSHGQVLPNSQVDFGMLFPINSRVLEWQDTKISVNNRDHEYAEYKEIKECLCEIIQGVKTGILPRMVVSGRRLWQQQVDIDLLSPLLVQDSEFRSLKELLQTKRSSHELSFSKVEGKDRLILSFVLATSLLHLYKVSWLQTSLSSETICFLVSSRSSGLDITKPYLTASCSALMSRSELMRLNEPHCFPDILSLGILLLEIVRGTSIEYQDSQDRCVVALQCLDKWTSSRNSCSWTVPDGLCRAISACIDPTHLRDNGLDKAQASEFDVRKYIFERILFPLEDALSTAYEVQLNTLHTDIAQAKTTGEGEAFDHYDEHRRDKHRASNDWREHLAGRNGVHDLVGDFQDLCENLSEADEKATHVKIAVLDTGLQLPTELLENHTVAGRISVEESESFLPDAKGAANHDWGVDCDGHGTCVGQIILDVAPVADLYVARVFKSRADLANPKTANQVHKRIVEAIDRATNKWKVDMIVMSFGFDEPIPLIRDAIEKASKAEKAPLFFAATRNDGAHKNMAWPARDHSVIGISSTDGYGSPSSFNPSDNNFHPILYAFGEGVPVKVPVLDKPQGHVAKHVSGTSYATPTAAALAANVLGCIRMAVKTSSKENQGMYDRLPLELQRMTGMLAILRHRMSMEHNCRVSSLLPWDFLNPSRLDKILEDVSETLKHY